MKKITKIDFLNTYDIVCLYNTGEQRLLDLRMVLDTNSQIAQKILKNFDLLKSAQVGILGEILWSDMGEITNLQGELEKCNYDICPDYAYSKSIPI